MMSTTQSYRLTFRAPLHIGERGVGLETTRTHVPADTLFGALCVAWRELFGVDKLCVEVLDWFREGGNGEEPFFLTSAFPFAGDIRFFPKPQGRLRLSEEGDDKALKRVRFVSEQVFRTLVTGEEASFCRDLCVNGGDVWVTSDERRALADRWSDDGTGDIRLWERTVVPRVTLDRITLASQIWHFGEVHFAEGVGLWFGVEFNAAHGLERNFEACLRLLGDMGLGGERGAGRGLFDFEGPRAESLPSAEDGARFVTLSPFCPTNAEEVDRLIDEGAAYELIARRGWITSSEASNLRRKEVWMFAEGSMFNGPATGHPGQLVNVAPDICPHDVWRYGYAFPVGVNTSCQQPLTT